MSITALAGHTAFYSMGTRDSSVGKSGWGMMLTTHVHLVLRLRMSAAIPPLPLHALMACMKTNLTFTVNNIHFHAHSTVHNVNIQSKYSLQRPTAIHVWRSLYHDGIKICTSLPSSCKRMTKGRENFKTGLKRYLNKHTFYGADEFFIFKNYLQSFHSIYVLEMNTKTIHCKYIYTNVVDWLTLYFELY
jgi:hypothetical protein